MIKLVSRGKDTLRTMVGKAAQRVSKAAPAPPAPEAVLRKRRRLSPEVREREIVDGAIQFFAEVGFGGGLRDLAKRLGITHQNLFRYFPTKEALIERVYLEVYFNRWQPEWETLLHDTSRPLAARLIDFYNAYLPVIFRYDWVRIFFFAGLKGVDIPQRYVGIIQAKLIEPLALELRALAEQRSDAPPSPQELEIAWGLHGELFYLAIRRWVYGHAVPDNLSPLIEMSVIRFLDGAPAALRRLYPASG
jgi:AcrR family transcriptional regulator